LEENKLKKFYNDQIKSKEKEIEELKRRLYEKDSDNRDIENKVADFERKLQTMMDGQTKLRDLEVRTMNLGMDNNLVKNTAELFKNQYR
jgi:septal ring factor EnvC (AmiA/AmiB activator)